MKKLILILILTLTLAGCASKYNTDALSFKKDGDNYQLVTSDQTKDYNKLLSDLSDLNIDLNPDTKVAVLATSTANIIDELGMNIVAACESDKLNPELGEKVKSGEVANLGSPIDPNLETLYQVDPDVVIVGSNFPFKDKYSDLQNLIVVPQDTYADIFYTTYGLMSAFDLDSHDVFNSLVKTDQSAKS